MLLIYRVSVFNVPIYWASIILIWLLQKVLEEVHALKFAEMDLIMGHMNAMTETTGMEMVVLPSVKLKKTMGVEVVAPLQKITAMRLLAPLSRFSG